MPTHKDLWLEEEPERPPWWMRLGLWAQRHGRTLTSVGVVAIIVGAALAFIVVTRRQRERAALLEVAAGEIPPADDLEALQERKKTLEGLRDAYRDTKAYPLIVYRLAVVQHRLWEFDEAERGFEEAWRLLPVDHPLRAAAEEGIEAVRRDRAWVWTGPARLRAESLLVVHPYRLARAGQVPPRVWPHPEPEPVVVLELGVGAEPLRIAVDPDRAAALAEWFLGLVEEGRLRDAVAWGDGTRLRIRVAAAPPEAQGEGIALKKGSVAVRSDPGGEGSETWVFVQEPSEVPEGLRGFGRVVNVQAAAAVRESVAVFTARVERRRDRRLSLPQRPRGP